MMTERSFVYTRTKPATWVGEFYNSELAKGWINSRQNPEHFEISMFKPNENTPPSTETFPAADQPDE